MGLDVSTGIGQVASLAESVVSRIWPDKTKLEQQQMAQALAVLQGQLHVDKAEAQSTDPLQHWRGGAGWVCVAALDWSFVLEPFFGFALVASGHAGMIKQL